MEKIMGKLIEVKINLSETKNILEKIHKNRIKIFEEISKEIKYSVKQIIENILNIEMNLFLGSIDQKENKRNGYKARNYAIKGIGGISFLIPRDRDSKFNSVIIPKNETIDPRIKEDLAVLHLAGLSTRTINLISKRFFGIEVSYDTVHQSLGMLSKKATGWLTRELTDEYWALYIDGTNFNVQRRNSTEKEPSLVVLGIDSQDKKSILAIEPGYKDNAECWRSVFKSLKERGLNFSKVKIGIMDGLPALEKVFKEEFPKSVTARCWVHAMKNALAKTPARLEKPVKLLLHKIMYANSLNEAKNAFLEFKNQMGDDAERAVNCIEKDLDSLLVHYTFDQKYWTALKTTNSIERINKEFKRRTKVMDSVGEKTLNIIVAFTALKMEKNWRKTKVDETGVDKIINYNKNYLEETLSNLQH